MLDIYLLLFIPAMIANGTPPIFAKLFPNFLNTPVDLGIKFRGQRILGDHKTLRGFLLGTVAAQIVFLLIYKHVFAFVPFYFGFLAGFHALLFDSIKSFFKRQLKISSGQPWFPFDQVDWIIGYLVVFWFYLGMNIQILLIHFTLGLVTHLISKVIGYFFKINKSFI